MKRQENEKILFGDVFRGAFQMSTKITAALPRQYLYWLLPPKGPGWLCSLIKLLPFHM